jgi:hypothetical protein
VLELYVAYTSKAKAKLLLLQTPISQIHTAYIRQLAYRVLLLRYRYSEELLFDIVMITSKMIQRKDKPFGGSTRGVVVDKSMLEVISTSSCVAIISGVRKRCCNKYADDAVFGSYIFELLLLILN